MEKAKNIASVVNKVVGDAASSTKKLNNIAPYMYPEYQEFFMFSLIYRPNVDGFNLPYIIFELSLYAKSLKLTFNSYQPGMTPGQLSNLY